RRQPTSSTLFPYTTLFRSYVTARSLFEESLALHQETSNARSSHTLLGDLGLVAYHQHEYASARALFEETLGYFRATQDKHGLGEDRKSTRLNSSHQIISYA